MTDRPTVSMRGPGGEDVRRPMTDEEFAEYTSTIEGAVADDLAYARAEKRVALLAQLAASDRWAARAVEDGQPMRPDRIAYRQDLRKLLADVETSDDPASIELPKA